MRIETILNKVYRHKSFIYRTAKFEQVGRKEALVVDIVPRKNGLARCSVCGLICSVYDHSQDVRLFDFIPWVNILMYFRYRMRRVDCPKHGIRVEQVPWAEGKEHMTKPYQLFLARWARKLSWKEVAESFGTTWDNVFRPGFAKGSAEASKACPSSARDSTCVANATPAQ